MEAVDIALYRFVLMPPDHPKGTLGLSSAVPTGDPRAETLLARAAAAENCLNLKLFREGREKLHQSRSSRQRRGNMFQLSV